MILVGVRVWLNSVLPCELGRGRKAPAGSGNCSSLDQRVTRGSCSAPGSMAQGAFELTGHLPAGAFFTCWNWPSCSCPIGAQQDEQFEHTRAQRRREGGF